MSEEQLISIDDRAPATDKKSWVIASLFSFLILGGTIALAYLWISTGWVYTDNASISADHVALAPTTAGILENIAVQVGDQVGANTVVARVGNELIKTKTAGLVIGTADQLGKIMSPGEAVVTTIDPNDLRVVAKVEEDKGLSDIKVGQTVTFTVDAFGSKKYEGVVDTVTPASHEGDVVFNISDKRETKEFDIKIRFDLTRYPELKDGMSAKVWIYK